MTLPRHRDGHNDYMREYMRLRRAEERARDFVVVSTLSLMKRAQPVWLRRCANFFCQRLFNTEDLDALFCPKCRN